MPATCANCNNNITHGASFCAVCGQKAHLHRLGWHDVLHDAVHYFTHADKGIFQLLKSLGTKTGTVAKEFVAGKRKAYFPPLNFFLIVAAIYVLVSSINAKPAVSRDIYAQYPQLNLIKDPVKKQHTYEIYLRAAKSRDFLSRNSNFIAILALPFTTFLFWIWYRRSGYNYIEHLVANMYMSGFTLLVRVLLFIPLFFLLKPANPYWELFLFFVFQISYGALFYYRFIGRQSAAAAWKATGVSFFVIAFWFFLSGMAVRLYIQNGFWGLIK